MAMSVQHIGLILDGNRRWAKKHGLSPIEGHQEGYKNLKTIVEAASKYDIKYISAYVFSSENWSRTSSEVSGIMKILSWVLKNELNYFHARNIRLLFAGRRSHQSPQLIKLIQNAENLTRDNDLITVVICLNYGGQQEITDAVKQIIAQSVPESEITPELIQKNLYLPDLPLPDLIIRTSGEKRLSNFLIWQSAYSELMFVDKLWPDFTSNDLKDCLNNYQNRSRRFGK